MTRAILILPHQLFDQHPCLAKKSDAQVFIVEDPLFFGDKTYPAVFHKQKLMLHRASMKTYEARLTQQGHKTVYIDAKDLRNGGQSYEVLFSKHKVKALELADPVDYIAELRLRRASSNLDISIGMADSPNFLSNCRWITEHLSPREHYAFTPFYIEQRKRLGILLQPNGKPLGGKWSYDQENRKKAPKGMEFPPLPNTSKTRHVMEAFGYVQHHYSTNYGSLDDFGYPTTHLEAKSWLQSFLWDRLGSFGDYQDAIVQDELSMMHSVLSPALNIGLLSPSDIVTAVLGFYDEKNVPLNSLEGFIRQVIGWREFIMGVYRMSHVEQRTRNFWGHNRKIPPCFYDGTTGILPIDATINKLLKHAYCHHIERLMVLGSFMLLCEFDPDEIYRWFMEMFIDAYDWVMVPNVYGMSQYADGGLMTTKPYICGSNYIRKMSDYPSGDWCGIWDGLFWRFLHKHKKFFHSQARLNVLCSQMDKMGPAKLAAHEKVAEKYLKSLDR